MEGSFWRLGHDLADLYTGDLTLRQLWLRLNLLIVEDSPLRNALRQAQIRTKERERAAVLDDVHTRYQTRG